ncbi:hypothetical protein E2320_008163, partial [Naja naja]
PGFGENHTSHLSHKTKKDPGSFRFKPLQGQLCDHILFQVTFKTIPLSLEGSSPPQL